MSKARDKREQAQRLLRSLSDIDDRFLMEAMEGFGQAEENGDMAGAMAGSREEAARSAEPGKAAETAGTEQKESGKTVRFSPRKLRRISTWALTAAACLTVAIVGRYVVLDQRSVDKTESLSIQETDLNTAVKKPENTITYDAAEDSSLLEEPGQAAPEAENTAQEAVPAEESLPEADMVSGNASEESVQESAESAGNMAKAANPFMDVSSLEKAEGLAGFEIELPEAEAPYTELRYRACAGEMLEIIFLNEDDEEGYRIRKAAGAQEDISGDYREYELEETLALEDGTEVSLRGDEKDAWETAVWQRQEEDGDTVCSYAVCAGEKTFTEEEISRMAEAIR